MHHIDFSFVFLPGGGEEVVDEVATISTVYIKPNAAEPTQDSTKVFTPRVETATDRETAQESTPRKPIRTEVRGAAGLGGVLGVHGGIVVPVAQDSRPKGEHECQRLKPDKSKIFIVHFLRG